MVTPDSYALEEAQGDEDANDADAMRVASDCLTDGGNDYNDEFHAV